VFTANEPATQRQDVIPNEGEAEAEESLDISIPKNELCGKDHKKHQYCR